jgi:iron complex outermembrane receptor protein
LYNNINSSLGNYRSISSLATHLGNASVNILDTRFKGGNVNQLMSDLYVENASFLRMDNINIGYNAGKVLGADLRINASIQNAFIITNYTGLDPEVGGGVDNNFYPRPRVFSLGFNFDF